MYINLITNVKHQLINKDPNYHQYQILRNMSLKTLRHKTHHQMNFSKNKIL